MKKSLVVLLIAVLALTSAFAAITGTVSAEYAFDLDKKTADYVAGSTLTAKFSFKEAIPFAPEAAGDYPYLDVAASATLKYDTATENTIGKVFDKTALTLTTFQIKGEDWTLDLIADFEPADFAESAFDVVEHADADGYKASSAYTYHWNAAAGYAATEGWQTTTAEDTAKDADKAIKFTKDGVGSIAVLVEKENTAKKEAVADSYTVDNIGEWEEVFFENDKGVTTHTTVALFAKAEFDAYTKAYKTSPTSKATEKAYTSYTNKVKADLLLDIEPEEEYVVSFANKTIKQYVAEVTNKKNAKPVAYKAITLADGKEITSATKKVIDDYTSLTNAEIAAKAALVETAAKKGKATTGADYTAWVKADKALTSASDAVEAYYKANKKTLDQEVTVLTTETNLPTYYYRKLVKGTPAVDAYSTTTFGLELASEEFPLTDDLTAAAAFSLLSTKKSTDKAATVLVGVSAKAAYADSVKIAADFGYDSTTKKLSSDVAFQAKYNVFTLDTYYANGTVSYYDEAEADYAKAFTTSEKGYFSAQVVADVEDIDTVFTLTGKNLLDVAAYTFDFKAETGYFGNFTFGLEAKNFTAEARKFNLTAVADFEAEYGIKVTASVTELDKTAKPVFAIGADWADENLSIGTHYAYSAATPISQFGIDVEYDAEAYTLTAGLGYNEWEDAKKFEPVLKAGWYLNAGIKTTKLVNGATLSLDYASGRLDIPAYVPATATEAEVKHLGTITAKCEVTFK